MSALELLRSAFRGLVSNKLRSALTMLGVLIGVAAVILLLAVGNGSAQQVQAAISSLGTKTITVRASGTAGFGASTASTSAKRLTLSVAQKLAAAGLGHVGAVVPQVSTSATVSNATASESSITVVGTTPQYFTATTSSIGSGSSFSTADVGSAARTAVIGSTVAAALFPSGSALGQTISVGGTPFTVVGVLATQSSVGFNDPNSVVVAPITRIQRTFTGFGAISSLTVEATSSDDVQAAIDETTIMLDQYLGVSSTSSSTSASARASGSTSTSARASGSTSSSSAPFTITDQSSLLQARAASLQSFTVLLGAVAAISLLVGGIGVTNVMLVTVTERTREIGIRKALGATRGAILGQFLVEAAVLTLLGGIAGVLVAFVGSRFTINGTQPAILGWSVPLALGVSVGIGVFFGVYPAARAAAMRPIQALRAI